MHALKTNREDFNALFKEYYPGLRSYAQLLIDPETAEDVVQEVFVHLWENRERIVIHTSTKAYLFRSVYSRCMNVLNRQKMIHINHQSIEFELRQFQASFFDPDKSEIIHKLYMQDLRNEITQAIDGLPKACREVFTLSYLQDMKNRDISTLLDISVSTVEKHINHALKTLRPLLKNKLALLLLSLLI